MLFCLFPIFNSCYPFFHATVSILSIYWSSSCLRLPHLPCLLSPPCLRLPSLPCLLPPPFLFRNTPLPFACASGRHIIESPPRPYSDSHWSLYSLYIDRCRAQHLQTLALSCFIASISLSILSFFFVNFLYEFAQHSYF